MFYLTTHSRHFYTYICVWHMVKDPLLPLHGQLFPISSNGSFICTTPKTGQHIPQPLLQSWSTGWNEKQLYGSTMRDRSDVSITPWVNALTMELHPAPLLEMRTNMTILALPLWRIITLWYKATADHMRVRTSDSAMLSECNPMLGQTEIKLIACVGFGFFLIIINGING